MQILMRFRREALLISAALFVLTIIIILTAPKLKPSTTNPSVGEALNLQNRAAPSSANVYALTDSQVAAYQDKLRANPNDIQSNTLLGMAYLQKAREAGDPTYYGRAEGLFKKALELDPKNADAMGGLSSLSLSRHQFEQGLVWGMKALALQPNNAYNYGVITDALVEMGRYPEAIETVQKMVDLKPNISSFSRVSYVRELHGLYDSAIEGMQQAVNVGQAKSENSAWVNYQLGSLNFNRNELDKAELSFQQSLKIVPDYVYAQAGLAKIKAVRGDVEGALSTYASITKRMPLAEFIIEYGDILKAAGKTSEATRQYDLVRAISRLYNDNGVDTDQEMALFDADHSYKLPEALAKVKKLYEQRPSIKVADTLAWTLYQTGDYSAAAEASRQALKLGTLDSLSLFHAGMIANKLGQPTEARTFLEKALAHNPNFSFLHGPEARQTLVSLGGAPASR